MATTQNHGYKKITATGTAVAIIASTQEYNWAIFKAPLTNEFPICIGKSTVTATNATTDGYELSPGESSPYTAACDLAETYINGHSGDGVKWWGAYTTAE